MSVRWIITSSAVVLLNSKMLSMSSFSLDSIAPRSSPRSTIMRISSSLTSSSSALGSMCSRRNTPFVDLESSQMTGRNTVATLVTAPTVKRATASVFFMAMRLGTSSPSTRLKYESTMVMSTTMIVLSVEVGMAVKPLSTVSQCTSGSEKLSAAKAEDRKPASVMAI